MNIKYLYLLVCWWLVYEIVRGQLEKEICYNSDEVLSARDILATAANCSNVWMSKTEQALIMSQLQKNHSMLEIGSGFSTLWYSQFVNQYVSIEHDKNWGDKVTKMIENVPGTRNISYNVVPVEGWDWDQGDGTPEQFSAYLDKIDEVSQGRKWDVVLNDGRTRVSVAERVLKYLKPDSIVIIHDFWNRKHYHSVLQLYNLVAAVYDGQSVALLKPKSIST